MNISIAALTAEYEAAFYALAAEYLPDSSPEQMKRFYPQFPNAYLMLLYGEELIGVAFGWERRQKDPADDSFELNGVAVRWNHQKKGLGKQLLHAFEEAARTYGAKEVSVGSAGGYVEQFYIGCGYRPAEYKVWINGRPEIEKRFKSLPDYQTYTRQKADGFVVMRKPLP